MHHLWDYGLEDSFFWKQSFIFSKKYSEQLVYSWDSWTLFVIIEKDSSIVSIERWIKTTLVKIVIENDSR